MSLDLMDAEIDAVVNGDHADPFRVLGMHHDAHGTLTVRAIVPGAERIDVVDARKGAVVAALPRVREAGFFAGGLGRRKRPFRYRLRVDGVEREDPYRFPPQLSDDDVWLLAEGTDRYLYRRLGAHPTISDGVTGTAFAVWAPGARRVSVVGPFNQWHGRVHPMRCHHGCGVWEIFIPGLGEGELYKYEVKAASGEVLPLKSDPVAFYAERTPSSASIVYDLEKYEWADDAWLADRGRRSARDSPTAIYEVHLGSWQRADDGGYLSYGELADSLVPYVRDLGFTHIELLPVSEYPFDGSWGYQPTGLFAPTSRFGNPDDFRAFIERCHREEISVLIDWVPGHFPTDPHGLGMFDGTHLYDHADPRKGRHMDWDTLIYNYGRREVANFLIANAVYWVDQFHMDGLRVDAVASMLYLDYSRKAGEWVPNEFGGNENLEAIEFVRHTNEAVYGLDQGAVTIAEESTAWPMVSRPTYLGGLGFGYKWNMGWMHDTLAYMRENPVHRRFHHDKLTFGLVYAFAENFVLPLSHDEVVHGKGSLLAKMPGDRWQRFANLRLYLSFMYTHPGKKLLFMGGEFAQEREWNHDRGLDWHLLEDPMHRGMHNLVRELNALYKSIPALHALDCEQAGFEWIDCNDVENSIISFIRRGRDEVDVVAVACNFTPVARYGYRIGLPTPDRYVERFNSDAQTYGGSGIANQGSMAAESVECHGRSHSIEITLPPLATVVLAPDSANGAVT
jgi:1,4-alpha-glucan branching enzyme